MINYNYEGSFSLTDEPYYSDWITRVIRLNDLLVSELSYVFCDDVYLLDLNKRFLNHDTLTDIITFDYSDGNKVAGDIFISVERVAENSEKYGTDFDAELRRVMIHGVLHLMGYGDKDEEEKKVMRQMEDSMMKMFHVEH